MKCRVDYTLCKDHGQCTIAAPKVFWFNDEGKLEYNAEPDDSLRSEVEEAADVCPEQAIFLDGA